MELDQLLFKKIWKFIASFKKEKNTYNLETTAFLSEEKKRLTILAQLLSGNAIEIFPAENYSTAKNNIYFLPEKYNRLEKYEDNLFYYKFRIFYLQTLQSLNINLPTEEQNIPIQESLEKSYQTAPIVLKKIREQFPFLAERFYQITDLSFQTEAEKKLFFFEWFGKMSIQNKESEIKLDKNVNQWEQLNEVDKKTVELNAKTKENINVLDVDKNKQEQYLLTHNFEKIETLDDFNGAWRDFDDDEDLEENREALEELNMNQMVRVDSPSHSIFHAEFFNSKGIKEATDNSTEKCTKFIDEWDYQNKTYKRNFCKILESPVKETSLAYTQQTILNNKTTLQKLEKRLSNFFNHYQKVSRQADGDEPDLDAITERFTDIYSGITPSENIFQNKRKKSKDLSILILTDISLSTDGYVNGFRVIDTEKQSLLLFGEILSKYDTSFQLDVFSSRTRNFCEYHSVKTFDEDWNKMKHRIGTLTPKGYTRIGAAIRNAHEHLQKNTARKKWLLLLTDGKPNDYDRYEGKYGIEDVKQAVREVRRNNIHISALAIDSNAKFYLPQMLGKGGFEILQHPRQLPEALTEFYLELMR